MAKNIILCDFREEADCWSHTGGDVFLSLVRHFHIDGQITSGLPQFQDILSSNFCNPRAFPVWNHWSQCKFLFECYQTKLLYWKLDRNWVFNTNLFLPKYSTSRDTHSLIAGSVLIPHFLWSLPGFMPYNHIHVKNRKLYHSILTLALYLICSPYKIHIMEVRIPKKQLDLQQFLT